MNDLHGGSSCRGGPDDLLKMQKILLRDPESLNRVCANQQFTPLARAVIAQHLECVRFLLNAGANPNRKFGDGIVKEALFFAVSYKTTTIAELLLKHGARANNNNDDYPDPSSRTMYLTLACRLSYGRMAKLLLDYGAITEDLEELKNPPIAASILRTPLAVATYMGDVDCIGHLLLYGALGNLHDLFPDDLLTSRTAKTNSLLNLLQECDKPCETKIRILNMYRAFGVELPPVFDTCRRGGDLTLEHLQEVTRNPLSLQSLARLRVYKAVGSGYVKKIGQLSSLLPPKIMNILHFDDLDIDMYRGNDGHGCGNLATDAD